MKLIKNAVYCAFTACIFAFLFISKIFTYNSYSMSHKNPAEISRQQRYAHLLFVDVFALFVMVIKYFSCIFFFFSIFQISLRCCLECLFYLCVCVFIILQLPTVLPGVHIEMGEQWRYGAQKVINS